MRIVSCNCENMLYMILYTISNTIQMIIIHYINIYPLLISMFLDSLSLLFFIILEDISIFLKCNKPKKKIKQQRNDIFRKGKIKLIKSEKHQKGYKTYRVISFISLGILTAINSFFIYFIYLNLLVGVCGFTYICNIILTWAILQRWFKLIIYNHHKLALVIIVLTVIMFFVCDPNLFYFYFDLLDNSYVLLIGGTIFLILAQSFREVIERYVLVYLYIQQSKILFFEGIIAIIINILLYGILQLFKCNEGKNEFATLAQFCFDSQAKNFNFKSLLFFGFGSLDTFYGFVYLIDIFLLHFSRININKMNGPTNRYSADLISCVIFMTYNYITALVISTENEFYSLYEWWQFVLFVILILGVMIYNENIRIHIFNLSWNTKIEIKRRALIDRELCDQTFSDSSFDLNDIIE